MASFTDPNTDLTSHMGGEGLTRATQVLRTQRVSQ